jgi:hypothetical protein
MDRDIAVSVDRDFARFGNKSYAINKINSVEVRERRPHGSAGTILLGGMALIFLVLAFQSMDGSGATDVFVALLCAAATYWAWRRSKIVQYQLFLMTSSSEAQAISSRDGEMIGRLRNRIESAMAGQLA